MRSRTINLLEDVKGLRTEEASRLEKVVEIYPFLSNDYYLNPTNRDDPMDPIKG